MKTMRTQRLDKSREKNRTDKNKQCEHQTTREIIAAYEQTWRIPSPPIVEKNLLKMIAAVIKHDVSRENSENATARQKP